MKIKLAILDKDKNYLDRIVSVFSNKYSDKLEVYSFSDLEVALKTINEAKIDVLVASDDFDINVDKLPDRCGFAYLVESSDIDMLNNQRTISKFQKTDLIYKQVLSIYSENASNITGFKITDEDCKLIAFSSPSGGVGSSTMAAACALHFAKSGKETLYLNLEKFGSSDIFFSGEGQFSMSDIIFALKSKKANLSLKLQSCVKKDQRGVYFFSQPKIALDMIELSSEEVLRLISELRFTSSYDYIILDMDFDISGKYEKLYKGIHSFIIVGDGSEISNNKVHRSYTSLATIDNSTDSRMINRTSLIYNKFSNKTSKAIDNIGIKNLGGFPRYEHASTKQILEQMSNMNIFNDIARHS